MFYEIGTLGFARRDCYEGYVPIYRQVSKYRLCCGEEFKSYHPSVKVLIVSRVALTEYTLLIHFGGRFWGRAFYSRHLKSWGWRPRCGWKLFRLLLRSILEILAIRQIRQIRKHDPLLRPLAAATPIAAVPRKRRRSWLIFGHLSLSNWEIACLRRLTPINNRRRRRQLGQRPVGLLEADCARYRS